MDNAELYAVYNAVQKRDAKILLDEFSSRFNWSDNENVLDIGCGPGDVSTEVLLPHLPKHASLVGVDLSENMVAFANEKFSNDRVSFKALDFATKDISKHLPERHFTKIFSCHCLHWIQDQEQLGKNLFSLLRPGGQFVAVMTPNSQLFLALKLLSDIPQFRPYCQDIEEIIPPLYYSLNPVEDFKYTLSSQGLNVITCEQRLNPVTYPNLDVMTRAFEAFNPFVKRMPENVKEEYLATFKHMAKKRIPIAESGEIHIQNPIIVVYAQRPKQTWTTGRGFSHSCSHAH